MDVIERTDLTVGIDRTIQAVQTGEQFSPLKKTLPRHRQVHVVLQLPTLPRDERGVTFAVRAGRRNVAARFRPGHIGVHRARKEYHVGWHAGVRPGNTGHTRIVYTDVRLFG